MARPAADGRRAARTVIFACIHNAGRSQMAAAWLERLDADGRVRVLSAGTEPGSRVHPEVVMAMREVGIELGGRLPTLLTDAMLAEATDPITMGCGDVCLQLPPGLHCLDWPLSDPKGQSLDAVRAIRDDIRDRVEQLLVGWQMKADRSGAAPA